MIAHEERGKGKKVKVAYKKLIVDGQIWRWNKDMGGLEKQVTAKQAITETKN